MNLVERVKNILVTPKTEWLVIDFETATPISLLTSYVLPLALIAVIGTALQGVLFAGVFGLQYFIFLAIIKFVGAIISFYLSIYVIDMLAPTFRSEKNLNKSAQLVAYSNTPVWIAGLLGFIPVLGMLAAIDGWVYSIYIMYLGIGPIKKTPEDQKSGLYDCFFFNYGCDLFCYSCNFKCYYILCYWVRFCNCWQLSLLVFTI